MNDGLPELKKGDVLVKVDDKGHAHTLTVIRVGKGKEFDEPVYYLRGMYGVKTKRPFALEELASAGYRLKDDAGDAPIGNGGSS